MSFVTDDDAMIEGATASTGSIDDRFVSQEEFRYDRLCVFFSFPFFLFFLRFS